MYPTDQDGLNSKLHAVCDGQGWLLSEGEMSDHKGAALMIDAFPKSKTLPGDRGCDANWFRAALPNLKVLIPHDILFYRRRHKIENMLGRLKDWGRIHTRDRTSTRLNSTHYCASRMPSSA